MPTKIIAVANQKGGVGKTTTAVNVAAQLVATERPVLLVDLDSQGNATSGLGLPKDEIGAGTYEVLCGGAPLAEAVHETHVPGLFLLPSNSNLAGAEVELVNEQRREFKLRHALEPASYNYIVIDCPPSLGLLTVNALAATHSILIPVQAEYYALEGLGQLLNTIQRVRQGLNPTLELLGVVLTMYDKRTSLSEQVMQELKNYFGEKLFKTIIPRNVRLAEAPSFGKTVFEHDRWSKGARAYKHLAKEVVERAGKKRTSLGRGFESLLPQNFDDTLLLDSADKIQKIAVDKLEPNRYQPRQEFDAAALRGLATSIKRYGVLQPLVVTPAENGTYMIIAGERRWRASQIAGSETVPAIVRTAKELERLEIALIENVQRVDLSPLEQAASIEYLNQQFGVGYDEIAKRLGKAGSTISNIVRLLQLPERAKTALRERIITEGHARAILALKDLPDKQDILLNNIRAKNWTVRQAEQFVVSVKEGFRETEATRERMRTETPATKKLSKRIGASVQIRRLAKGGKLEIAFKSDSQLEKIIKALDD